MEKNIMNLIDLKASLIFGTTMIISFSNAEIALKLIALLLTIGYTIRRWYLLEKNKKDE